MLLRKLDQLCNLFLGLGIDHNIGNAAELRVLYRVHLLLRVAVAVTQTDFAPRLDLFC